MADGAIGRQAASGMVYVGASQAIKLILTTLSTIVIARLLLPDDYGVIAMVTPVTGFILLFQQLGLNQAVVQAREISAERSNALFWINMAATAAIVLVLLAIAPLVAWFYGDPRAGRITAASAVTILLIGTSLQHGALMNRHMRFAALSVVDVANALANFLATLVAAYLLRTYWALWLGGLVGTLVQVLLLWHFERWRPSLRISLAGTRQMLRFGRNLTGFNILSFLARNLDNVLVARTAGPADLGLYDRSYKLMMLPLQNINAPLGRIMLPVLSRLQDDPVRYRRSFLLAVRMLTLAALPGLAVTVATSGQIVTVLLGERWAAAGPIFFWLSLASLVQPMSNATGWLFLSSHRTGAMLRWGLFSGVTTLIGFAIGIHWGAVGIAASLFVVETARVPFLYPYCVRGTGVTARDLYATMAMPLAGAALTWIVAQPLAARLSAPMLILTLLPVSYAIALLLQASTRPGRDMLRTLAGLAAGLVERGSLRLRPRRA